MPPLQFASCLPAGCCVALVVMPPPPLILLMLCLCLAACRLRLSTSPPGCHLFASWLSCRISLRHLHLASPFVAPPPHMSILDPLLSFAPAGCCIASHCAASASHPLVNTTASQHAAASRYSGNSTSHLPLVHSYLTVVRRRHGDDGRKQADSKGLSAVDGEGPKRGLLSRAGKVVPHLPQGGGS